MWMLRSSPAERAEIAAALEAIRHGGTATLPGHDGQPAARNRYQRIQRIAWKMFGNGGYSMRGGCGSVVEVIRRLPGRG